MAPSPQEKDRVKYILLIYEAPEDFESRQESKRGPYVAAWRAYHKALVEAGAFVGGAPLKEASRPRSNSAASPSSSCPPSMRP